MLTKKELRFLRKEKKNEEERGGRGVIYRITERRTVGSDKANDNKRGQR